MKLDNYFLRNKQESPEKIMNIFSELNNYVNIYIKDKNAPILDGKIDYYKTLTENKHIPIKQQDVSKVLKDFSKMFQKAVIWENPSTMINITPPANIVALATAFYTSIFNPNFAQDESSGYLMTTELLVSKYLSELVGWNTNKSRGIFTFGGKGTNLYAVKMGIKKAIPNVIDNGISNQDIVIFSNEKGHPCHIEICDWLGIGKKACKRTSVKQNGELNIQELEKELRKSIENNQIIGCIILNGGTTNEIIVDPIKEVVELRDKLVKEYNLNYTPHIHVDSVIGWAWLFFNNYDFKLNPLNMTKNEINKIKSINKKIKQIKYADSFGADFHKTGFCPYVSSIIMCKDFNDLTSLGNKIDKGVDQLKFGEYSPFEYTLELTRSSLGPVAAYATLETFGISGFQELIYNIFSNSEFIRKYLNNQKGFEVINMDTEGIATLFVIFPKNDNKTYNDYLISDDKKNFLEYNHQFYLYCLKLLEEKKIHFKITFSKSYKPYQSKTPTGALKIYPTSPIVSKEEIKIYLNELIETKKIFDNFNETLIESRDLPIDYVYRD